MMDKFIHFFPNMIGGYALPLMLNEVLASYCWEHVD